LLIKIQALSGLQNQTLEARVRIQPAGRQAHGDLVCIGDTVPTTGEDIFAESLGKVEAGQTGVVQGQRGLVAIRHVQIVNTRLQGLNGVVAKQGRITLEGHARIHGQDRQDTALSAGTSGVLGHVRARITHIPVCLVLAHVQASFGRNVPTRADDGVSHRCVGRETRTIWSQTGTAHIVKFAQVATVKRQAETGCVVIADYIKATQL